MFEALVNRYLIGIKTCPEQMNKVHFYIVMEKKQSLLKPALLLTVLIIKNFIENMLRTAHNVFFF